MSRLIAMILLMIFFIACEEKELTEQKNDRPNEPFVEHIKVGIASVNISPNTVTNIPLGGYQPRKSTGLHDHIYAKILLLDNDTTEVVLISLDLPGANYPIIRAGHPLIEAQTGIKPDKIFFHATHTHSSLADEYFADQMIVSDLINNIIDGINTAKSNKVGARVRIAQGTSQAETINRRYPQRAVDNTLFAMFFEDESFKVIASLINFSCHPVVLGDDNLEISSDFVHYLRRELEQDLGGMVAFFNGSFGDINPKPIPGQGIRNRRGGTFNMAEELGSILASEVMDLKETARVQPISLNTKVSEIPFGDRYTRVGIIDLTPVQIACFPGEPLTGFSEKAKQYLTGEYKLIFGLTDDYYGYLVPEDEWGTCFDKFQSQGCYEETQVRNDSVSKVLLKSIERLVLE